MTREYYNKVIAELLSLCGEILGGFYFHFYSPPDSLLRIQITFIMRKLKNMTLFIPDITKNSSLVYLLNACQGSLCSLIIPILQVSRLSFEGVKSLAQGHATRT